MMSQLKFREWVLVVSGVLAGGFGGILLKMGAKSLLAPRGGNWASLLMSALCSPSILLGLGLYLIPTVIWIWLLRTIPLTVLQPILSLTYVLTALLAPWILREPVPPQRWLGMGVIMAGIILVSRS